MPRQDLELPPPVDFVHRAEHERVVAEKDVEIARLRAERDRLREALWKIETFNAPGTADRRAVIFNMKNIARAALGEKNDDQLD